MSRNDAWSRKLVLDAALKSFDLAANIFIILIVGWKLSTLVPKKKPGLMRKIYAIMDDYYLSVYLAIGVHSLTMILKAIFIGPSIQNWDYYIYFDAVFYQLEQYFKSFTIYIFVEILYTITKQIERELKNQDCSKSYSRKFNFAKHSYTRFVLRLFPMLMCGLCFASTLAKIDTPKDCLTLFDPVQRCLSAALACYAFILYRVLRAFESESCGLLVIEASQIGGNRKRNLSPKQMFYLKLFLTSIICSASLQLFISIYTWKTKGFREQYDRFIPSGQDKCICDYSCTSFAMQVTIKILIVPIIYYLPYFFIYRFMEYTTKK